MHQPRKAPSVLLQSCLIATAIATTMAPLPASAVFATEVTQILNNFQLVMHYVKQIEQYQKQVQQYQTQLNQYKQMYVTGAVYKAKPGFREEIEREFPERDLNYKVDDVCRGFRNNPVGERQREYCVAGVQTRNRRFNTMRKLLKDVAQNDKDLAEVSAERASIAPENQGALQANTNKIAAINSKMQNDLQNAEYTMNAYNAVLTSLQEDTVIAANGALKNQNDLLGTVVQGALLKGALDAARMRDR